MIRKLDKTKQNNCHQLKLPTGSILFAPLKVTSSLLVIVVVSFRKKTARSPKLEINVFMVYLKNQRLIPARIFANHLGEALFWL
jgi:hypothetical protein